MASTCRICFVRFDSQQADLRPRMLPCGHTFCTGCLRRHLQSPRARHTCPTCRQALPAGTVDSYPINYTLEEMLRENPQVSQEQVPEQNDTAGQAGAASQASATHERSLLAESSGPHSHSLNSPLDGPMRQNLQVSHEQPPEHSNTAGQAWAATQGGYAGLLARHQPDTASRQQQRMLDSALLSQSNRDAISAAGIAPLLGIFGASAAPLLASLMGSEHPPVRPRAAFDLLNLAAGSQQNQHASIAAGALPLLGAFLGSDQPAMQEAAQGASSSLLQLIHALCSD